MIIRKTYRKTFTALVLPIVILFSGCYYDHAEELYPTGTCDATNITYANGVQEIMTRNSCLSCHSGTTPDGGILLDTYANVKLRVSDGKLWGSINHLSGFKAMPQGASKISQCDINKIKAWMDAGTPQ
jgi:cytochrome c5